MTRVVGAVGVVGADVHTLTGAYALNALEGTERDRCVRHLAACEPCAREVAELRATAARLAAALTERPPSGLRDRVFADLGRARQEPVVTARLVAVIDRLRAARNSFAERRGTVRVLGPGVVARRFRDHVRRAA